MLVADLVLTLVVRLLGLVPDMTIVSLGFFSLEYPSFPSPNSFLVLFVSPHLSILSSRTNQMSTASHWLLFLRIRVVYSSRFHANGALLLCTVQLVRRKLRVLRNRRQDRQTAGDDAGGGLVLGFNTRCILAFGAPCPGSCAYRNCPPPLSSEARPVPSGCGASVASSSVAMVYGVTMLFCHMSWFWIHSLAPASANPNFSAPVTLQKIKAPLAPLELCAGAQASQVILGGGPRSQALLA